MLDLFTLEQFSPLVNTDFIVSGPNGATMPITLVSAESLAKAKRPGAPEETRAPFSLVFRGPHSPQLAQGTFRLAHPAIEHESYFLVPIKSDESGMYYEAVFA